MQLYEWVVTLGSMPSRLYLEKLEEIDEKIQKVTEGNAPEYLHPRKELQRTLTQRLATAEAHLLSKVNYISWQFGVKASLAGQPLRKKIGRVW